MVERVMINENTGTLPTPSGIEPRDAPLSLSARHAAHSPHRPRPQNIGGTERAVSVTAGAVLALYGLTRRSPLGTMLAGLGALLAYRGASGHSRVYQRMGVERADAPIEITQAVTIGREPEEVYAFWRRLENLPQFMRHLRSVQQRSPTQSHWIAQPPVLGRSLEWDAEIVEDRPGELLRWHALPGSPIEHHGEVRFNRAPGGRGTEVHVHLTYRPPMGVALGTIIYPFSKQMLKEEIRRLKGVMEAGEIPTIERQPSAREPHGAGPRGVS
jgi:uncharacterized membrane protein